MQLGTLWLPLLFAEFCQGSGASQFANTDYPLPARRSFCFITEAQDHLEISPLQATQIGLRTANIRRGGSHAA
jgi:hypothetical protein